MTPTGLTHETVRARHAAGDGNTVTISTSRPYWQILWQNIFTFVNIALITIGLALVALGLPEDALTTVGLVLINITVGLVQESRAKYKLDRITLLNRPQITVIRDGSEQNIPPQDLVLGDVMLIRAGDQIAADGTILQGELELDESLLTGEADAISKTDQEAVMSGSVCLSGIAYVEITAVGDNSFANQLTLKARRFKQTQTPLQKDVNRIIQIASVVTVILGAILYQQAISDGQSLAERVQMMAVVVGMIPQGLIVLFTLSYALGAVRMAGRGALIQRMNAIESMSNVNVLCVDKTGTLTTNQMHLQQVQPVAGFSESEVKTTLGNFVYHQSDPNRTSLAILSDLNPSGAKEPIQAEIPFSSQRRWSGLCFADACYVLGAPEAITPNLSSSDLPDFAGWLDDGLRVLVFAKADAQPLTQQDEPRLPQKLQALGLIALGDQLRPDAQQVLADFQDVGIQLKVISGDNPQTVAALARRLGFDAQHLATGADLDTLNDAEFDKQVQQTSIFGRITPQQKERIVQSLMNQGAYVAMLGDGVNDVMSLKEAHLGIAMQSGSPATQNAADVVLLNDAFDLLPSLFAEGQRILNSMHNTMRLLLMRTTYTLLLIIATSLMGWAFPFLPRHEALNSFVIAGLPPMLLAAWVAAGTPTPHLLRDVGRFIVPVGFSIFVIGVGVYGYYHDTTDVETARTMLLFTTALCGILTIFWIEPPTHWWAVFDPLKPDWRVPILVVGSILAYILILFTPSLRDFFALTVLSVEDMLLATGLALGWIVAIRPVLRWVAQERE